MSWGEMCAINSNMQKPLNVQLRSHSFNTLEVVTATGTYTPKKTGLYRVICVGAGGGGVYRGSSSAGYLVSSGGGGGVAIKDMVLNATTSYNVTVSTTASFGSDLTATSGTSATLGTSLVETDAVGGTGSGGLYNFTGEGGKSIKQSNRPCKGGSVQCAIPELIKVLSVGDRNCNLLYYGNSLLGYGGGGPAVSGYTTDTSKYDTDFCLPGLPAAVIIITLETEGY